MPTWLNSGKNIYKWKKHNNYRRIPVKTNVTKIYQRKKLAPPSYIIMVLQIMSWGMSYLLEDCSKDFELPKGH